MDTILQQQAMLDKHFNQQVALVPEELMKARNFKVEICSKTASLGSRAWHFIKALLLIKIW